MARAVIFVVALPCLAGAQTLPAGPVSGLDGRLALGAELVATAGNADEIAFFNYTDYERNVLRMVRLAFSAAWRPTERVALVGELRSENFDNVRPYAAYVRVRPWRARAFDIQAGRIPPAFGSFGRRTYYADNPLVGYPLAYQYLTSLRPDAIPATLDDLRIMRARGWRLTYPIGSPEPGPGVPLISAFQWDTGVQAHWRHPVVDVTGAVTSGTLSDPRISDNNGGKQVSGRVGVRPATGLVLGASAARGEWLDGGVARPYPGTPAQTAFGADAEYSRDYWLVRAELVWSRWNVPLQTAGAMQDLDALATWIEGRYRLTPRIFLAGRVDRLGFSRVTTTGGRFTWDAPVSRVEAAAGYYLQRNLVARVAVQRNDRDGGRILSRTFFSGQLAYWF